MIFNSQDKESYVYKMFQSIAPTYDLLNKLMSFGLDKYWRYFVAKQADLKPGNKVLDVGAGTGRLSLELARSMDDQGTVVCMDFSENMLKKAEKDLEDHKYYDSLEFKVGNAMNIPFSDNEFEVATNALVLRNVEDISTVLSEMTRVIKPGGKVISLDLAKPKVKLFKYIYYLYLNNIVPLLGRIIYGKRGPYDYLPKSLKEFPNQDKLSQIHKDVGLINVQYYELTGGIVAVHVGEKPH
ncbi:bifunctional demethylmenaquinone methyltransferase/2-methoxy-6-polyprenyl-1,4-benzoquinol methylase UbiE [Selenihalanaerobacter shriftii]|uniref:Demethylmenaquinone methyltransferase n=1 Tax=Selenihalanaerobacter shriftii TaxID=142842 RepID=A0A1T4MIK8_9FIRM|nr:bifunctional demethylmenaquinone methyltransferase/2-methoxy-6-polyprenyl-1,4-benzoquinol methylase UbiE [Selenihalanaerobacter shriftii]SJZ66849.1 demethylmenaquinone methyltransferase / 2-methoxy-6-polyprenyl-1,4-benzoquinol methylase [Selenihalanaerobacter shriftii]